MKRILVPTDFSNCANDAVAVAYKIAQLANAEILFMHILVTPIDWIDLDISKEKQYPEISKKISKAKVSLKNLVKEATKRGIVADKSLTFSEGTESIVDHAKLHDFDLIVMGSHGASGFREVILGSNAQRLVTHSKTPVLIIKSKLKDFHVKNILFSSTFRENVHPQFHHIIKLADILSAHINLLYVNERKHFETSIKSNARMKRFLEDCPRGTCSINIYNDRSPEEGILNFAKENNIDLISIVTYGSSGLFTSTLTERLVNHSELPILSVNIKV